MIKALLASFILLLSSAVYADDFVNHITGKAQSIPQNNVQVINFWASWCQPCRKEMPDMNKWYNKIGEKQKISMVGIAIDSPENVRQFLKQTPVNYLILRYTGNNSRNMMKQYGNQIGGLPYTVIRNIQCHYEDKIVGELTFERLDKAVKNAKIACKK